MGKLTLFSLVHFLHMSVSIIWFGVIKWGLHLILQTRRHNGTKSFLNDDNSYHTIHANGHIMLNTPVLVRSLNLSNIEPSQYLDGWLPGNTGCFSFFSYLRRIWEGYLMREIWEGSEEVFWLRRSTLYVLRWFWEGYLIREIWECTSFHIWEGAEKVSLY